jgi:hypothetical protein
VDKPVIGQSPAAVAAPVPQTTYVPAAGVSSGGWSSTPRSSWDFGKFPPYSH